jgi:hypothetical protein
LQPAQVASKKLGDTAPVDSAASSRSSDSTPSAHSADSLAAFGLAILGYLPVEPGPGSGHELNWRFAPPDALIQEAEAYSNPWTDPNSPFVRGALLQFEAANGLPLAASWQDMAPMTKQLLISAGSGKPDGGMADPWGWSWVDANAAGAHQSTTLYSTAPPGQTAVNGGWHAVASAASNSGAVGNATPAGTFPIYSRHALMTMSGVYYQPTANGLKPVHYTDHNVPMVSFFNGDFGLHPMKRDSYGSSISPGCIEIPMSAAPAFWNGMHYGTMVTVDYSQADNSEDTSS